jgi:hypothetical protein
MLDKRKLEEVLRGLDIEDARVEVHGGPRFMATVASPSFAGQHEGVRQAFVWRYLHTKLSPAEQKQIEFIFTNTHDDDSSERR